MLEHPKCTYLHLRAFWHIELTISSLKTVYIDGRGRPHFDSNVFFECMLLEFNYLFNPKIINTSSIERQIRPN